MDNIIVKVENEKEFNTLMYYYEIEKGWTSGLGGKPNACLFDHNFNLIDFSDNFLIRSVCSKSDNIINFKILAQLLDIKFKGLETISLQGDDVAVLNHYNETITLSSKTITFADVKRIYRDIP